MLAVHARYRGRENRRAKVVRDSAEALSTLAGVGEFEVLGVEDIRAEVDDAESLYDVVMALISDGNWAVGIGIDDTRALDLATDVAPLRACTVASNDTDVAAVFTLLAQVLSKRSEEGREATSLVRAGYNQNEAAEELGISKQAMSQRLHAAGWGAEQAGWGLALNLIRRASGS